MSQTKLNKPRRLGPLIYI